MSGAYGSSHWLYDADVYQTGQSLKFNDDDSSFLSRTPTTAGNRDKWTWSAWVKLSTIQSQFLFSAYSASSDAGFFGIAFISTGAIRVQGWNTVYRQTNALFRDSSAWYNILLSVDTANGTADDRIKLFVNGSQITSFATNNSYTQNDDTQINNTSLHYIGRYHSGEYFDGYMADVHFIDGQALDPTSFIKTENNQLQPKEYLGSYGTNGFRLNFQDDIISEGFNVVTYKGNGSSDGQSISGLGLSPDLVWLKERTSTSAQILVNTLRGANITLESNNNNAEFTPSSVGLESFDPDGFTIGSANGAYNSGSDTYVAWCWDAGSTDSKTYTVKVVSDGGNKYRFDDYGTSAVTLDLAEGGSYVFDQSDSSNDGHPMKFSTTSNGSHGGGSTYSTGVTYELDGVTKTESDYVSEFNSATTRQLKITVAASAPTLYYWCHYHSGMGGAINTNATKGSSNFDGAIQSVVKANTTKGFAIGTFTKGSGTQTIGHGLGAAPDWLAVKRTNGTGSWFIYHSANTANPETDYLRFNSSNATADDATVWGDTAPTSSVFSVSTAFNSGEELLFYAWTEISSYSKFSSYTGNGSASGPSETLGFAPAYLMIKRTDSGNNWVILDTTRDADGQLTKFLAADANQAESDSAQVKTQVDADGFTIKSAFDIVNANGGTYIYMAFADTREAAFFKDVSGNNNNFTPNNLDYRDSMIDTPLTNFCTFNPAAIDSSVGVTLSEGNLGVKPDSSGGFEGAVASFTLPRTGKWYWEYRTGQGGSSIYGRPSIITADEYMTQTSNSGEISGGSAASNPNGVLFTANDGGKRIGDSDTSFGSAVSAGDIIGNAYNADTGQWFIYINNSIQASGAAISESIKGNLAGKDVYILHERYNGNGVDMYNFGQDSSFSGAKIPQGNGADGEDFFYAPPTGFKSLQLSNLPTPAIADPTAHFDIVTYTGTGSTNSIGGLSFQPDWVWGKRRDTTGNHWLNDAVRGATKGLHSDSTNNQYTDATVMNAFTSDGFTVVSHAISNASSGTYVAWNWKAGSTTPSQTYTVKVVSDSGNKYRFDDFGTSAVTLDLQEGGTYTFDQSDSSNSGHPFRFSTTSDGTHGSGSEYTTGVTTNGTAGQAGAYTRITVASGAPTLYYYCAVHSGMGGQANTNSTFGSTNLKGTIQSTVSANTSAGVSIISYTGTGSAATIGHQLNSAPSMVIIKNRDATDAWRIYHASVSTSNNKYLVFGTNALISGGSDKWNGQPTSTVFGVAGDGSVNRSNEKYIMYAFHSVESFSKVGSYVGNGNANGPFVPLNFRASWIMIKNTTGTGGWEMHDNKRIGFNPADESLDANTSAAEATGNDLDILSNGFKIRNTYGTSNTNGSTYVYLAFAESPFKTTSAR